MQLISPGSDSDAHEMRMSFLIALLFHRVDMCIVCFYSYNLPQTSEDQICSVESEMYTCNCPWCMVFAVFFQVRKVLYTHVPGLPDWTGDVRRRFHSRERSLSWKRRRTVGALVRLGWRDARACFPSFTQSARPRRKRGHMHRLGIKSISI